MTDEEIIIKFMEYGWGCTRKSDENGHHQCVEGVTIPYIENFDAHEDNNYAHHGFLLSQLRFSSDWRSLMPVIEKLTELEFVDGENYHLRTFGMKDSHGNYMVRINRHQLFREKILISATYLAVMDCLRQL